MGDRRRLRPGAVADAGPLIHLHEVGAEAALGVFEQVLVPEPVATELRARPDGPAATQLKRSPFRVVALTGPEKQAAEELSLRYEVSLIDASVLAVAKARKFPIVATDDLQLRDATKHIGLQPAGTLGILLRSVSMGMVSSRMAEAALDAVLTRSSLFVTRALVDEAKAALQKGRR